MIIDQANNAVDMLYKMKGWEPYLRMPPPTNPINTAGTYCLEFMQHKEWSNYFFSTAQSDGPCKVAKVETTTGSPLSSTGSSTIAFTWTYDSKISFNTLST